MRYFSKNAHDLFALFVTRTFTLDINELAAHRFFHVDRYKLLTEGQEVKLDERGLSRFGTVYWDSIRSKPFEALNDSEQREYLLEAVRNEPKFSAYVSRMRGFYGTNSIEEAKRFLEKIEPRPAEKVPVFEVFATKFWTLDMNWLDYSTSPEQRMCYLREYWYAAISNHNPEAGERKPPLLEVLMELPVRVGKVVEWI